MCGPHIGIALRVISQLHNQHRQTAGGSGVGVGVGGFRGQSGQQHKKQQQQNKGPGDQSSVNENAISGVLTPSGGGGGRQTDRQADRETETQR